MTRWLCRCGKSPATTLRVFWDRRSSRDRWVCYQCQILCPECIAVEVEHDANYHKIAQIQNIAVRLTSETKEVLARQVIAQALQSRQLWGYLGKTDVRRAVSTLSKGDEL